MFGVKDGFEVGERMYDVWTSPERREHRRVGVVIQMAGTPPAASLRAGGSQPNVSVRAGKRLCFACFRAEASCTGGDGAGGGEGMRRGRGEDGEALMRIMGFNQCVKFGCCCGCLLWVVLRMVL